MFCIGGKLKSIWTEISARGLATPGKKLEKFSLLIYVADGCGGTVCTLRLETTITAFSPSVQMCAVILVN